MCSNELLNQESAGFPAGASRSGAAGLPPRPRRQRARGPPRKRRPSGAPCEYRQRAEAGLPVQGEDGGVGLVQQQPAGLPGPGRRPGAGSRGGRRRRSCRTPTAPSSPTGPAAQGPGGVGEGIEESVPRRVGPPPEEPRIDDPEEKENRTGPGPSPAWRCAGSRRRAPWGPGPGRIGPGSGGRPRPALSAMPARWKTPRSGGISARMQRHSRSTSISGPRRSEPPPPSPRSRRPARTSSARGAGRAASDDEVAGPLGGEPLGYLQPEASQAAGHQVSPVGPDRDFARPGGAGAAAMRTTTLPTFFRCRM